MTKKRISLCKIKIFHSLVNHPGVAIESKQYLWNWHQKSRRSKSLPSLLVSLVASLLFTSCSNASFVSSIGSNLQSGMRSDQGCTIFYAAGENVALAGNNEDYSNPYTYIWFMPPEPGKYGRVYFGYEDGFPQGGVNDKGLFYDGSSLPLEKLEPNVKPVYNGIIPRGLLFDKILSESATVSEAIAILDSYNHYGMDTYQSLFGDANGDSFIVDGDTILRKQGSFQIATNFRLTENPDPPYPCPRYTTTLDQLSKADSFSVELFRNILDATHQELPNFPTLYSNIYDLKKGLIYLYIYHDFENPVVIDVTEELAKGYHYYSIASLFPTNKEAADYQAQRQGAFETKIPRRVTPTGQDQYTDYAGDYRTDETGEILSIYQEGEHLYFQQNFSLPIELFFQAKDKSFHQFHDGSELVLYFQRDDLGEVTGAMGALYGVRFELERLESAQPDVQLTPTLVNVETTITVTATSEINISPTATQVPALADPFHAFPWWGWTLAAIGAILILTIVVRFTIKR